ncbi:polymer-forming cytoskeletal protein [Salmonella enterica subsp. enterica]|nr:polymer-forming cytoskeletal protein [Salmonella enterica]ECC3608034.1 polymer-forming cytoskeletal protein [Salmonella enterica subsp. enterica]ECY4645532.1 polymer-forming cytoskeletal protein [Salmonella enterica subsp. enterica serovar Eastbourne]EBO9664773.1 polymer-forming cytoskeletal protein [Salmonella enterica]ECE0941510.1 polymer-forming cytoskeletal protein [Salmonella enterica subsp. enterica]
MFNKKSRPSEVSPDLALPLCASRVGETDCTLTVIGQDTVMEGNILRGTAADVYGSFTGDITMQAGTARIMPGGKVNGMVQAAEIVVGGEVEGCCEGQSVTVLEQGVLRGTCRSSEFSIRPGGMFTGISEALSKEQSTLSPARESLTRFVCQDEGGAVSPLTSSEDV